VTNCIVFGSICTKNRLAYSAPPDPRLDFGGGKYGREEKEGRDIKGRGGKGKGERIKGKGGERGEGRSPHSDF